jgi:hypothetical protein
MPKRRLSVEIEDDGTTVVMTVRRYETVGGVEIGPTLVFDGSVLSFPSPVVEDWQRDMVVMVAERL